MSSVFGDIPQFVDKKVSIALVSQYLTELNKFQSLCIIIPSPTSILFPQTKKLSSKLNLANVLKKIYDFAFCLETVIILYPHKKGRFPKLTHLKYTNHIYFPLIKPTKCLNCKTTLNLPFYHLTEKKKKTNF